MGELKQTQGEHVLSFLKEQGISQEKLAQEIGVSAQTVNRWVKGKVRMSDRHAEEISKRYPKYSAAWLQGSPSDYEFVLESLEDIRQTIQKNKDIDDNVRAIAEASSFSVEHVNEKSYAQCKAENIPILELGAGYDVKITSEDKECILTGDQWRYFCEEIIAYAEMRLNKIFERNCW